jgi:hypothetical protein
VTPSRYWYRRAEHLRRLDNRDHKKGVAVIRYPRMMGWRKAQRLFLEQLRKLGTTGVIPIMRLP